MSELDNLYAFRIKALWEQFWKEGFAFWMICGYLFFEYVRPQSIYPSIDILPWSFLCIILAAIGLIFDPKKMWARDPVNKWLVAFVVVTLVSSFNAYWPNVSYANLDFVYTWVIIYFLIINIVNTPTRFYIFLLLFCLASFKLSFHGAYVWTSRGFGFSSWGITGPPGFFRNSGELSIQMLIFFPIAFYLYQNLRSKVRVWEKLVLLLFFVTPVMTILGASSRGAQLALLVQCSIMFYRKIFRVKVIIGVIVFGFLVITFLPEEQKARFETMGDDKTSEQRLLYWKAGIEMIKEHPALGIGYWNFIPYFESYYSEDMLYKHAELPHNIFIQVATDSGLIGLTIYMFVLMRFTYRKEKLEPPEDSVYNAARKGIPIGIVGFVIAGQFVSVAYYPFIWIGVSMWVALQHSFRETLPKTERA